MTGTAYARIRRGQMAADSFTQISNRLFRDPRIGFKAKGIFGLISTHRDGYGINPKRLAEQSTDGLSAIRAGLRELETFGYLVRSQERRPDGTLGPVEYLITDMPDGQTPSSQPVSENPPPVPTSGDARICRSRPVTGFPHADKPHAENRTPKNNKNKNTSGKNTNPTSPTVPHAPPGSRTRRGADGGGGEGALAPGTATAGQQLLWEISDSVATLALPAATVRRLGGHLDELLARGWTASRLRTVLTLDIEDAAHPRTVLAWRIDDLLATPVPAACLPRPARILDPAPIHHECPGNDGLCGRPVRAGEHLCGACRSGAAANDPHPVGAANPR
ncbi:hypothetical protein ACFQZC_38455 [Streptacidiphilus monticola]